MDKPKTYNEWHSSLEGFEGLRHANCCRISYEAGQQSRQAELDQQKLLTVDSELHLDAAKEEIERLKGVVDKALNLINNWWHPNVDQKLFVEALGRALRGEHG